MDRQLSEYRAHAAEYGLHLANGDSERCNSSYRRVQEALVALARADKRNELFLLYDDPDPNVQCWAAAHTLEVDAEKALDKLRQIETAAIPIVSTDAHYTIEEWLNGNLSFLKPSDT